MSEEASEEVIVVKERHIPVSKDHFLAVLLDKLESEKERQSFGELASCIETLFYVNRIAKIEEFKQCYSCFSRLNESKHNLSYEELKSRQIKLMNMIFSILSDAHFEAITFEMYKNSIEKVFLSDLPIKVDWGKLDSNLLTEFYEQYPSQNPYKDLKYKPPFYQHFAMFYRGYGLNIMSGLFITPKLNLILADLIPMIQSKIAQFISHIAETLFGNKNKNKNQDNIKINKSNIAQEIDMLSLKRISLLDTYNLAKSKGSSNILWWFLKNIQIQEPTFKRLMLIYRKVPETFVAEQTRKLKEKANKIKSSLKKSAKKKLGLHKNQSEEKISVVDEIGRKRKSSLFKTPDLSQLTIQKNACLYPIRIQYFNDIPMSDLEVTYPAKKFSLKPMDNLYLTFTITIGIWAILQELLFSTDTTIGYWIVMVAIFLMIRSLIWYRATESEYVRVLNQALVESNISCDNHSILSLIDSLNQQQFMQTILAYFVLLTNETEVISDSDGVDRLCEKFMTNEFGSNMNVMIDGAMNKLSQLGLFKSDNDESIKVKGLSDALACAHSHYQSAIQTVRKIDINAKTIVNDKEDEKQSNVQQVDELDDAKNNVNETPPIITADGISGDHFGKNNDDMNENVQLID